MMTDHDFYCLPAKAIQIAKNTIAALEGPSKPVIRRFELTVFRDAITVGEAAYKVGQRYGRGKSPLLFPQPVAGYAPALYCLQLQNLEDAKRVRESRFALYGVIKDCKLSEDNTAHSLSKCLYVG